MRRRTVLASGTATLAASVAGCLGTFGVVSDEPVRTMENIQVDEGQPGPLAVEFEWLETRLSADTYPQFDATIENTAEDSLGIAVISTHHPVFPLTQIQPDVLLGVYPDPPRDSPRREVPLEEFLLDTDGCSRIEAVFDTMDPPDQGTVLEPGEHESHTFGIVGNDAHLDGDCPPPGTYRARPRYHFELPPGSDSFSEEWGFEFDLVE